jgi:pyruvate ferredoxin oxidoreductase beta subunit
VGYPIDFINKVNRAKNCEGTSFIHVYASCPTGWGVLENKSIEIAKEAVDCGLWILSEYLDGEFIINRRPKAFSSVKDHLKKQGQYSHLSDEAIEEIIRHRDEKWKRIVNTWGCKEENKKKNRS